MKLEYIGHACFRLTAQDGTRVITDPYDGSVGIATPTLEAEMITMSHEHHDHNCMDRVVPGAKIVRGPELAEVSGVTSRAVRSWHDEVQGQKRGVNMIRLFGIDGLKVVHMGDQGCMPDPDVLQAIADADVMMLPVGGYYTVDAAGARAIIEAARPRCVVPMHFRTEHGRYSVIADEKPFLALMGCADIRPVASLTAMPGDAPRGVVLLQPQADALTV